MRKLITPIALGLILLPGNALATEFQVGELVVLRETINDDAYLAGGTVRIEGQVNGDAMIGAGKVVMDGQVSQDLTVAGGDVWIKGEVGDDLRVIGGSVYLDGTVKDDFITGTGDLEMGKDSFVGGNLILGSGSANLHGTVNGNVIGGTGQLNLNGEVLGNVFLETGEVKVGPDAKIRGNLNYSSRERIQSLEDIVEGEVSHEMRASSNEGERPAAALGFLAGFSGYRFLSMLLFGLFLIWMYRYAGMHASNAVYESPFRSLGVGFLFFLLTPIVAILFAVTVIGAPIFVILLMTWGILLYMGKLLAAMALGGKVVRIDDKASFWRIYGSFAMGALVYNLIGIIPFFGVLINFILILVALGGFMLHQTEVFHMLRKKKLV